jgi:hypothetical protein
MFIWAGSLGVLASVIAAQRLPPPPLRAGLHRQRANALTQRNRQRPSVFAIVRDRERRLRRSAVAERRGDVCVAEIVAFEEQLSFPALHLRVALHPLALGQFIPSPPISGFHFGPLFVHFYGLMYVVGIALAIYIARRRLAVSGGNPDLVYDVACWGVPVGLIGARIYFDITTRSTSCRSLASPGSSAMSARQAISGGGRWLSGTVGKRPGAGSRSARWSALGGSGARAGMWACSQTPPPRRCWSPRRF